MSEVALPTTTPTSRAVAERRARGRGGAEALAATARIALRRVNSLCAFASAGRYTALREEEGEETLSLRPARAALTRANGACGRPRRRARAGLAEAFVSAPRRAAPRRAAPATLPRRGPQSSASARDVTSIACRSVNLNGYLLGQGQKYDCPRGNNVARPVMFCEILLQRSLRKPSTEKNLHDNQKTKKENLCSHQRQAPRGALKYPRLRPVKAGSGPRHPL
ncbi:Protein of unknown function [Gryllus bimaculatus]|nr:Protein of unknown function [Gryllus bimaculatus]